MAYDPKEQVEIEQAFLKLLKSATKDGAKKRKAGEKVSWKFDPGHHAAMRRHYARYVLDPLGTDDDSGAHHLVAVAWRALAIAWQDTHPNERAEALREAGYGA
jgi:hypothetical protein